MSPGDLPAPELFLNTFRAQEGENVPFGCSIGRQAPATRIVFCKDGVEMYSLKAQRGQLSYFVLLNITRRSAGMYSCGYQHRNENNRVRSSALSASQHLAVTDPHPPVVHTFSTGIVLGVVAISLLLLAAASYCAVKKGACGERCQRQQQLPSHEAEATDNNEIQCEYLLLHPADLRSPLSLGTPFMWAGCPLAASAALCPSISHVTA
ncbi:uncharacterized protein LOC128901533 [Rissa tridactyla]|uniref:uncharacterized protein LOC128901533 n=1 Tax=Rissa tridactyla TaxID=75485 RepID=UPI0023BB176C|nr:uncharacterized protein LOC128901533 [Rissa tridactyla]